VVAAAELELEAAAEETAAEDEDPVTASTVVEPEGAVV